MRRVKLIIEDEESDERVTAAVDYHMIKQVNDDYGVDVVKDVLIQLNEEMNNKLNESIEIF
jgi:predicted DNA-binding protein (UPF0278 family)